MMKYAHMEDTHTTFKKLYFLSREAMNKFLIIEDKKYRSLEYIIYNSFFGKYL